MPHQWHESFTDMKSCGFDAVALSFSESEMKYSRRTFEKQVNMAHQHGLKVIAIPSRLGGRLAGAPYMASLWLAQNPQAQLPERPWVACVESSDFRNWIMQFITTIVKDYEIDGIIWDEPKMADFVTSHPETIAKFGKNITANNMAESFAELIGELSDKAKIIRPDISISIFNMPGTSDLFTVKASNLKSIDYAGFDGNFSRQSFFHEKPEKMKASITKSWNRTLQECTMAGKKTFALLENMLMPADVHEEYKCGLIEFLNNFHPDHLACYYYAHNNECPQQVHDMTVEIIRKYYLEKN